MFTISENATLETFSHNLLCEKPKIKQKIYKNIDLKCFDLVGLVLD